MPEIARFYGIVICMYGDEHDPPHLHAKCAGDEATFLLRSGELDAGWIPAQQAKRVRQWIALHRAELLEIWGSLQSEQKRAWKVEPLD